MEASIDGGGGIQVMIGDGEIEREKTNKMWMILGIIQHKTCGLTTAGGV